jgi:hypothetical protein
VEASSPARVVSSPAKVASSQAVDISPAKVASSLVVKTRRATTTRTVTTSMTTDGRRRDIISETGQHQLRQTVSLADHFTFMTIHSQFFNQDFRHDHHCMPVDVLV